MRAEVIDYDYIKTLSPELQEYMAKFTGEFYGASFEIKKDKSRPYKSSVHTDMKQVKKARDANNRRNNDVYGSNRANGLLFDVQNSVETKDGWYITNGELQEMNVIAQIDNKEHLERLTMIEFLESYKHVCDEMIRVINSRHICQDYSLDFDTELPWLLAAWENKKITKRKLEALLERGELKKYIQENL